MLPDRLRIDRVAEHSFLGAHITPDVTVVDLGVNEGAFMLAMARDYGCKVVGLEPVPELFARLPSTTGVIVEQAAITPRGESRRLYVNPTRCATLESRLSQAGAEPVDVAGSTLAQLLDRHHLSRVPLVKVDIEGAEIEMFEAESIATLQRVDQFSVEFHDFIDPSLAPAVRRVRERLRSAGFVDIAMGRDQCDVLFVNRARLTFGRREQIAVILAAKYPRGILRLLRRRTNQISSRWRARPGGRAA